MSSMNWTRAAYLFFALAVLAALAKLGTPDAATRSFVIERHGQATAVSGGDPAEQAATTVSRADDTGSASVEHARRDRHGHGDYDPSSVFSRVSEEDGPPVFHRPGSAIGTPAVAGRASGPVCGDLKNFPRSSRIVFPVEREHFSSYEDTWGASRPQGGHEGTDLMVPAGTPLFAVTDGTLVPVSGANGNGWNTLGGYTVMLEAAYDIGPVKEGDLFYYAHLDRPGPLPIGRKVRAGQLVGYAGDTGQGPEGTRGLFPPHLHLGWYDTTGARTELASGAMNPFPLLEWIKANGGAVRGGSVARYCQAPQTGIPTPSTGQSYWPFPTNPGMRPDMDTGSTSPKPSPVVEEAPRSAEREPREDREPAADRPSSHSDVVEETTVREDVRVPGDGRTEPQAPPRGDMKLPVEPDAVALPPDVAAGGGWRQKVRRTIERVRDTISGRELRSRPEAGGGHSEVFSGAREERPGTDKTRPERPGCKPLRAEQQREDARCRDRRSDEHTVTGEDAQSPGSGGETTAPEKTTLETTSPEATSGAGENSAPEEQEQTVAPEETTGS